MFLWLDGSRYICAVHAHRLVWVALPVGGMQFSAGIHLVAFYGNWDGSSNQNTAFHIQISYFAKTAWISINNEFATVLLLLFESIRCNVQILAHDTCSIYIYLRAWNCIDNNIVNAVNSSQCYRTLTAQPMHLQLRAHSRSLCFFLSLCRSHSFPSVQSISSKWY